LIGAFSVTTEAEMKDKQALALALFRQIEKRLKKPGASAVADAASN